MAEETESKKANVLFRPNWHPNLSPLLGDIKGQYAYINQYGMVELIGPLYENPNISAYATKSDTNGPVRSITATGTLGSL